MEYERNDISTSDLGDALFYGINDPVKTHNSRGNIERTAPRPKSSRVHGTGLEIYGNH
jgi:hypothetical protein